MSNGRVDPNGKKLDVRRSQTIVLNVDERRGRPRSTPTSVTKVTNSRSRPEAEPTGDSSSPSLADSRSIPAGEGDRHPQRALITRLDRTLSVLEDDSRFRRTGFLDQRRHIKVGQRRGHLEGMALAGIQCHQRGVDTSQRIEPIGEQGQVLDQAAS